MGCGCNKKTTNMRRLPVSSGMRLIRPAVVTVPIIPSNQPVLKAQSLPTTTTTTTTTPNKPVSAPRLDADKLRIEKLRRAAIRKALNK